MRLRIASSAAAAPSPRIHRPVTSGTPFIGTPPTITQGRNALVASTTPATNGMKYVRIPGRKMIEDISDFRFQILVLRFLPLLVPAHLNRLELGLVRALRIVGEAVEREDAVAQVGEPDGQRIHSGKLLGERDPDVFRIGPLHDALWPAIRSDFPSWMPPPSW